MDTIPVLYNKRQVAPAQGGSPSAAKPAQVVEEWARLKLPCEIYSGFDPATFEQLTRAHDAGYVRGVLNCTTPNGFGTFSRAVADSLPYTSGSMLAAARAALQNGKVACSPTSGFHHAGYQDGGGFCTFNGLMVTALDLLAEGEVKRVGILDCDQHYGDGTVDILQTLPLTEGRDRISHHTIGQYNYRPVDADRCIQRLNQTLRAWKQKGVEVVLYQAGADPHIADPLGGFLTTAEMARRDRVVFEACAELDLPVAWNLAGGYQKDSKGGIQPVLDIHSNTMRECARVYVGAAKRGTEVR